SAISRPSVSAAPPAANGEMIFTAWLGQLCACACGAARQARARTRMRILRTRMMAADLRLDWSVRSLLQNRRRDGASEGPPRPAWGRGRKEPVGAATIVREAERIGRTPMENWCTREAWRLPRPVMEEMMARCDPFGIILLTVSLAAGTASAIAQERSQYPDWSGQWTRGPGMGNAWDPTKPPGLGQQAPLTPEYRARLEAVLADKAAGGLGGDPTAVCLPHGMPRMMIGIYPIEFVITPKVTYVLTDYTTHRRIFTDNQPLASEQLPSFNGYS